MMSKKIIIYAGHGAINIMRIAYAKIFNQLGWQVKIHNPEDKSVATLDVWDSFEPDVAFLGTYEIDRPTFKAISKRPHVELILWGPNYGDMNSDITPEDGVLCISEQEKIYLDSLIKTHNIRHIYTYYHQNRIGVTHGYYKRDFGLEPIGICLAADLFDYSISEPRDEFKSDWSIIGGHWSLKAQNLNKYLYPLCMIEGLKGRIYGYGSWAPPQYVGPLSNESYKHVVASTLVMPNIFEPHSIKYGADVNERAYKILAMGGFVISQRVASAVEDIYTNNEMVFVDSPEEFVDKVLYYVKNPGERIPYINRGIQYAYSQGTYFHRMRQLAETRGWIEEIIKLENITQQIAKVPYGS